MGRIDCLTFAEAWALISAGLRELERAGKAANLCAASRYGQVLSEATMEAARPVTARFALLKARQAALSGQSIRWLRDKLASAKEEDLALRLVEAAGYLPERA